MNRDITAALLEAAQLAPGMRVLDLACGSGDPAITLAERVEPAGEVVATDLVPGMVALTTEHARRQGVANLVARQADAEALPFPDASFDVVTA